MDHRQTETAKAAFTEAFLSFYSQTPFEKISVKELARNAHYSRGAFYIHYGNTEELLHEIEDQLIQTLRGYAADTLRMYQTEGCSPALIGQILRQAEANRSPLRIMLKGNRSWSFIQKLHKLHNDTLVRSLAIDPGRPNAPYILEYITSAHLGMLFYWIETGEKDSLPEIISLMDELTENGIRHIRNTNG